MVDLQPLRRLAAPRQASRPPIALGRLGLFDRTRQRWKSKRAKLEDVGFVQKGA
jgi:hypothetical protein